MRRNTSWAYTGEVGFVKIVYTERVQDGVERLGLRSWTESVEGCAGAGKFALESLRSSNGANR